MKRISNKILLAALAVLVALSLASCKSLDNCGTKEVVTPVEPTPVTPAEEPVVEEVFKTQSYSFKVSGFDFKAELVADNQIVFTYPAFITDSEIVEFAQSFFQAYPLYLQNSTLEYGQTTALLTLGYNVTAEEFNSYAPQIAETIVSYVDAYIAHLDKVAADLKAAEEAKAAAEKALAEAKTAAEKKAAEEAKAAAEKAAAEAKAAADAATKAAADKEAAEAKAAADKAAAEAAEKAAAEAAEKAAAEQAAANLKAAEKAAAEAAAEATATKAPHKSAAGVVILIIVICLAAAAAVYYFLIIKKKK